MSFIRISASRHNVWVSQQNILNTNKTNQNKKTKNKKPFKEQNCQLRDEQTQEAQCHAQRRPCLLCSRSPKPQLHPLLCPSTLQHCCFRSPVWSPKPAFPSRNHPPHTVESCTNWWRSARLCHLFSSTPCHFQILADHFHCAVSSQSLCAIFNVVSNSLP